MAFTLRTRISFTLLLSAILIFQSGCVVSNPLGVREMHMAVACEEGGSPSCHYSTSGESPTVAKEDALAGCGEGCSVVYSGRTQCVAYAAAKGGGGPYLAVGRNGDEAQLKALETCLQLNPGRCVVEYSNC